jgi:cytochrome c
MRALKLTVMFWIIALFTASLLAFVAGDPQKGRAFFCDEAFAGAPRERSCNSCHVNGKGLEYAGHRIGWTIMGKRYKNLEDAVNYMIETGLHGKAIDPRSEEMTHIVAYIKSL